MNDINNYIDHEQWNRVLEDISNDKGLIPHIDPYELALNRFKYQLAENSKKELIQPFGKYSTLLKVIEFCKNQGMKGLTIPQATAFQQMEQVKILLEQGHYIDEQDFGERTGLLVAATLNDIELVNFFIENGAFVSFYDQNNYEAIDFTTSDEIIDILKKHNGKTKEQRRQEHDEYCEAIEKLNILREINLSFIKGAQTGDIKRMEESLQKSSMPFITLNFEYTYNRWTALHYAAKNNDMKTFDFLISKGIDTNVRNSDGLTAHELAKKLGHNELCKDK